MKILLYTILISLIIALGFSIKNDKRKKEESISSSETSIYSSPNTKTDDNKSNNYKYVDPYITRNGKFVKGHGRKPVSTDPNAFKNRAKSRYYYETHKYIIKERRKSKNK